MAGGAQVRSAIAQHDLVLTGTQSGAASLIRVPRMQLQTSLQPSKVPNDGELLPCPELVSSCCDLPYQGAPLCRTLLMLYARAEDLACMVT